MILSDLFEGAVKRSDPYISGEREGPRPTPAPPVRKSSRFQKMADRSGKTVDQIQRIWDAHAAQVDKRHPNAYGIITARVQRELGLREEKRFEDNENGTLVFGWKSKDELCDEEDDPRYIPTGYNKILELGGIYANEPGKGQGDVLMKQFLSSPEAEQADLIFLDPVPNLGKNFKAKSEDEQVADLVRFYKRYGFRHNPRSVTKRMWLVKKGTIADEKLPT